MLSSLRDWSQSRQRIGPRMECSFHWSASYASSRFNPEIGIRTRNGQRAKAGAITSLPLPQPTSFRRSYPHASEVILYLPITNSRRSRISPLESVLTVWPEPSYPTQCWTQSLILAMQDCLRRMLFQMELLLTTTMSLEDDTMSCEIRTTPWGWAIVPPLIDTREMMFSFTGIESPRQADNTRTK